MPEHIARLIRLIRSGVLAVVHRVECVGETLGEEESSEWIEDALRDAREAYVRVGEVRTNINKLVQALDALLQGTAYEGDLFSGIEGDAET